MRKKSLAKRLLPKAKAKQNSVKKRKVYRKSINSDLPGQNIISLPAGAQLNLFI